MAALSKATARDLATLSLATALANGDPKGAASALEAGADPNAFWIDGETRLRDLVGRWGGQKAREGMGKLLSPKALKAVPSKQSHPEFWSESFTLFVARRGHGFHGRTTPLNALGGSELKPIPTVKAAVRTISSRRLKDAVCSDSPDGKASHWQLWLDASWTNHRRKVGFWLRFAVDAPGWSVAEEFEAARSAGEEAEWPRPDSAHAASQKDWEGANIMEPLAYEPFDIDMLVSRMRAGGSPFATFDKKPIGDPDGELGSAETKAFMDAVRETLGSPEGWHLRIAPLLTAEGVAALREKAALGKTARKAVSTKKPLASRTDII